MNWSKTLPTKSGWYWRKTQCGVEEVVFVDCGLRVRVVADAGSRDLGEHYEWSGPLEPPQFTEE